MQDLPSNIEQNQESGGKIHKYALLISYVGTPFCGWQRQDSAQSGGAASIQQTLEEAVARITGETPSVVGSGRTDAGVHALGQAAHFVLKNKFWEPRVLHRALNFALPRAIRIRAVQPVSLGFHAQRSAIKKQYSYYFQQGPSEFPHLDLYSWWIHKELNIEAMDQGLKYLLGEREFRVFQGKGAKPGSTVRTLFEAEAVLEPLRFPGFSHSPEEMPLFFGDGSSKRVGMIRLRLVGSGFLKQMVRGIAGTALQVGEGYRPAEWFRDLLETQERRKVGPTAPARALWLEKVWYPPEFGLPWN